MQFSAPETYQIIPAPPGYTIVAPGGGGSKFGGQAARRCPKLYVISGEEEVPLYIGATVQPMRTRLRQGWQATGATGYYGYRWRSAPHALQLDVFYLLDCQADSWSRELQTVEAEVAFLVREAGQWPVGQTEIHFFPSDQSHRDAASAIAANYTGLENGRRTKPLHRTPAPPPTGEDQQR